MNEIWVNARVEKAKGMSFFGIPLLDLTREQLIACAVEGWESWDRSRENSKQMAEMMRLVNGMRR